MHSIVQHTIFKWRQNWQYLICNEFHHSWFNVSQSFISLQLRGKLVTRRPLGGWPLRSIEHPGPNLITKIRAPFVLLVPLDGGNKTTPSREGENKITLHNIVRHNIIIMSCTADLAIFVLWKLPHNPHALS